MLPGSDSKRQGLVDTSYYVYILFDWRGVPRYVGKGKRARWNAHENKSDPKNWLKNEFIEQTYIIMGELPKIKVREHISNEEAIETEIALIKAIGRFPKGPLTNLTNGGDGISGGVRPPHVRDAVSRAQKGVPETPEAAGRIREAAQRPERRLKISQTLTGRPQSDEHREKNRIKSLGTKHSEETRKKMSDSRSGERHPMWGKNHSEESKLKISLSKKGTPAWNKGKGRTKGIVI